MGQDGYKKGTTVEMMSTKKPRDGTALLSQEESNAVPDNRNLVPDSCPVQGDCNPVPENCPVPAIRNLVPENCHGQGSCNPVPENCHGQGSCNPVPETCHVLDSHSPAPNISVKICGITSLADAREATLLGANILGFNFYRPSPRYIEPRQCAQIIKALAADNRAKPLFAGVFVNATKDEVGEIIQTVPLDVLQFHGDETTETPEYCQTWPAFVTIKALRLSEERVIHPTFQKDLAAYLASVDYLLLDAYTPNLFGGSGQEINPLVLKHFLPIMSRSFIAGGLTPENVAARVAEFNPHGVDVASGVELSPGIKDKTKMHAFFAALDSLYNED